MSKMILKEILNERNLTIYQLSKATSISTSRLYDIVKDKVNNPRIDTLIKIARVLELTNDEFAELCGYNSAKNIIYVTKNK